MSRASFGFDLLIRIKNIIDWVHSSTVECHLEVSLRDINTKIIRRLSWHNSCDYVQKVFLSRSIKKPHSTWVLEGASHVLVSVWTFGSETLWKLKFLFFSLHHQPLLVETHQRSREDVENNFPKISPKKFSISWRKNLKGRERRNKF